MFHLSGQKHLTNVPKITCPATATAKIIINTNITPKTSIHTETSSCIWEFILSSYIGIIDPYEPSKNFMESHKAFLNLAHCMPFGTFFRCQTFPKANKKSTFFGPFRDKNSLIQLDACDAGLHDTRCQNFELPAVIKR